MKAVTYARRLEDGLPEWRATRLPIIAGGV